MTTPTIIFITVVVSLTLLIFVLLFVQLMNERRAIEKLAAKFDNHNNHDPRH